MLCEGLCNGWFHRHCAGLSVAYFDALCMSVDPFLSGWCSQGMDLKNTVNSLQE